MIYFEGIHMIDSHDPTPPRRSQNVFGPIYIHKVWRNYQQTTHVSDDDDVGKSNAGVYSYSSVGRAFALSTKCREIETLWE